MPFLILLVYLKSEIAGGLQGGVSDPPP